MIEINIRESECYAVLSGIRPAIGPGVDHHPSKDQAQRMLSSRRAHNRLPKTVELVAERTVDSLQGRRAGMQNLGNFYVFVDNSNIWIEGKKVSGRSLQPPTESDYWYRVDAGKLLEHVQSDRRLSDIPQIYGSVPPPNDTVWQKIRQAGFDVKLFERNVRNKEKGLDMELGLDMNDLSRDAKPGTMALVAGDADYVPVLDRVRGRGWIVEVWYWSNAAEKLQDAATSFHSLDDHVFDIGFRQQQRR